LTSSRLFPISRHVAAGLAPFMLLSACAVGPDFARPSTPASGYSQSIPPAIAATDTQGGNAQHFTPGAPVAERWWNAFGSPALDALIDEGLKHNPTLEAADASLRQSQEAYYAGRGSLFPTVNANFSQTRQKNAFGGSKPLPPYSISSANVSVSQSVDVFGASLRGLEGLTADKERTRFQREAAYLTLTANIISAVVQAASYEAQIAATQQILDVQSQQLEVLKHQLDLGAIAEADVLTETTEVAQTRATLPPLQRALAQSRNQLLALVGRYPDDTLPGGAFDLASIRLPEELPVSLPSQIVAQRPDIRIAEETLHNANAQIGVATAALLPQITLTGSVGSVANPIDNLFSSGTGIWSIGASVLQPIFRGGSLWHERKGAIAARDVAAAQYRETVIGAFQNVSDSLHALATDADALRAQTEAERAARESLAIAQNRFQTGATSFITLLDAQRTYQQARIALVQAQAARYSDTAALFVALGGGWWNRPGNEKDAQEIAERDRAKEARQ